MDRKIENGMCVFFLPGKNALITVVASMQKKRWSAFEARLLQRIKAIWITAEMREISVFKRPLKLVTIVLQRF